MSAPARLEGGRLAITGIGMASSLGDAVTACAAARAGLVRPRPLPLFTGMDGGEPAAPSGHPCADVIGFEGFARLCYLTRLALEDLLTRWTPAGVPPARIAVLINLPTSDERPLLLEHLVRVGHSPPGALEADVFPGMLRPMMPRALQGASLHVVHGGHVGGSAAARTRVPGSPSSSRLQARHLPGVSDSRAPKGPGEGSAGADARACPPGGGVAEHTRSGTARQARCGDARGPATYGARRGATRPGNSGLTPPPGADSRRVAPRE